MRIGEAVALAGFFGLLRKGFVHNIHYFSPLAGNWRSMETALQNGRGVVRAGGNKGGTAR
jgi:hypothetical protein